MRRPISGPARRRCSGGAHDPARLGAAISIARRARSLFAALAATGILAAAVIFDGPRLGWIALAALLPFTRVLETSGLCLQSEIAWRLPVATRAAGATLRLAASLALWRAGVRDAGPYVLVHAAGASLGHVLLHLAVRERLRSRYAPSSESLAWSAFLRTAVALGLAGLCQQAYLYVDNLFVRALCGEELLAHYNAGVRLSAFLLMFAVHATGAALPWLVRRHRASGPEGLGRALERLSLPLAGAGALVAGAALPVSAELCGALFGADYAAAGPSLRWLLGAAALVFVGAPLVTGVVALGSGARLLRIAAAALGLNVVGNALLIPALGIEGAAIATLGTELAVLLGAALTLRRAGVRGESPALWLVGPCAFLLGLCVTLFCR